MALKKKKKGKKKKSSAAPKEPADLVKPVHEVPIFLDPIRDAPKAILSCHLANPGAGMFDVKIEMKISNRLYSLQ